MDFITRITVARCCLAGGLCSLEEGREMKTLLDSIDFATNLISEVTVFGCLVACGLVGASFFVGVVVALGTMFKIMFWGL